MQYRKQQIISRVANKQLLSFILSLRNPVIPSLTNLLGVQGFPSIVKNKKFIYDKANISLLTNGSALIMNHIDTLTNIFKDTYDVCSQCFQINQVQFVKGILQCPLCNGKMVNFQDNKTPNLNTLKYYSIQLNNDIMVNFAVQQNFKNYQIDININSNYTGHVNIQYNGKNVCLQYKDKVLDGNISIKQGDCTIEHDFIQGARKGNGIEIYEVSNTKKVYHLKDGQRHGSYLSYLNNELIHKSEFRFDIEYIYAQVMHQPALLDSGYYFERMLINEINDEYCNIEYEPDTLTFTTYIQGIITNKRVQHRHISYIVVDEAYNKGILESRKTQNTPHHIQKDFFLNDIRYQSLSYNTDIKHYMPIDCTTYYPNGVIQRCFQYQLVKTMARRLRWDNRVFPTQLMITKDQMWDINSNITRNDTWTPMQVRYNIAPNDILNILNQKQ